MQIAPKHKLGEIVPCAWDFVNIVRPFSCRCRRWRHRVRPLAASSSHATAYCSHMFSNMSVQHASVQLEREVRWCATRDAIRASLDE